jgi:hypothetical protein
MNLTEKIHAILLGFHTNTETFQSANEKIRSLIAEECNEELQKLHNSGTI